MINRRIILKAGLVGTTAPVILNTISAQAGEKAGLNGPLAGTVFFTSENPGRWAGKEKGHAPTIERTASNIEIVTGHEMRGFEHYIVKHQLLDENFQLVDEKLFDPDKDAPITQHSLKGQSGQLYALSMCNLHDVWITGFKV
ncbi:MAG: desulfoferrodoxin family protein [Hyphomicrobiales bacterium]